MRLKRTISIFAGALLLSAPAPSFGQTCAVSDDKEQYLLQFFCGAFAENEAYRFTGENCIQRSMNRRLEDSVMHLISMRVCGYDEIANEYALSLSRLHAAFGGLTSCVGEPIDLTPDFRAVSANLIAQYGLPDCTATMKSKLDAKIPEWRDAIAETAAANFELDLYTSLGLSVDDSGIISELSN